MAYDHYIHVKRKPSFPSQNFEIKSDTVGKYTNSFQLPTPRRYHDNGRQISEMKTLPWCGDQGRCSLFTIFM